MSTISRTYTDLDLNFTAHPVTGDIAKRKGVAAIIGSLRNLLLTSHYERLFQPQIGSNLNKILFEPIDNLSSVTLADEIRLTVSNYEPRVSLQAVDVVPDFDGQKYDVTLTFFMINNPEPITISLFLERVR